MSESLALAAEICAQLEAVRRDLSLSQVELSAMAGMSQGAVSNCLQGKAVRTESLHRLLSAFAAAVASAPERGVSLERAEDLRKVIEAARRLIDGSSESKGHLARPGGPIPEDAANRIRRPEDQQLLAALADAPFTAAVTGPPECGKSTLLQLLASEARRQGFKVCEFDAAIVVPPGGDENEQALSHAFFRELAEEVGRTLGERPDAKEDWTRFDLLRYLKDTRLRRPAPPLLIVVDHAFLVPLALEELIQVCRSLDSHRGRTQLSWAIEISDLPGSDAVGVLSRLTPSPQVELGNLTPEQVQEFAVSYGLPDHKHVRELWEWFSGQPFLTHVALTRWRELSLADPPLAGNVLWERWRKEIEDGASELGGHLCRLKTRLHARSIWKQIDSWSVEDIEIKRSIEPSFAKFLKAYGLLDSSNRLVKFYRDHMSRL